MDDFLNQAKYQVMNPIYNAYKENVPASIRMYAKQFTHPTPVTENNFTSNELGILRDLVYQSKWRLAHPEAMQFNQKIYNQLKGLPKDTLVGNVFQNQNKPVTVAQALEVINEWYEKGIQYPDYDGMKQKLTPKQFSDSHNTVKGMINASYQDPVYSMRHAVGRADIIPSQNGDLHLKDTYNYSDPSKLKGLFKGSSPEYMVARELARKYGTSFPMDINLGNTKNWKGY